MASPNLVLLVGRTVPELSDWFDPARSWRVRVDPTADGAASWVRLALPMADVHVGDEPGDYDIVVFGAGAPETRRLTSEPKRWWSRLRSSA